MTAAESFESFSSPWTLARRAERMNPSILREILKVTDRPGILSMAGGLPSPESFPVEAMRAACERVLRDTPREALQYAASEGFAPLREWVAAHLAAQGMAVGADQVTDGRVCADDPDGLDDLLGVEPVEDRDRGAFVRQPLHAGMADADRAAGDDAGLALDTIHRTPPSRWWRHAGSVFGQRY